MQRVEGMKELFLSLDFALQELDVVDQQHINIAIALLKSLGFVVTNTVNEVVGEFLGTDITHTCARVEVSRVVTDGVQ
ncbi:unannotated protein [freshwater metagenome]|uniref:Unannotated protein n=1 Tax=freshwater metagenome TaxID=449393 RepID=A0A6J6I7I2_9ZZZZ